MKTPAPFISLDGIDGTGKSTQCRLLIDWLSSIGIPAIRCADPGGTPVGDQLRAILLNTESRMGDRAETLLFMASRAELVHQVIRPALEAGTVVISDRFVSANVVYQGHAGDLDPEEIRMVGLFSTGQLMPDLTMILDMPIGEAAKRRGRTADRLESRGEAYFERVRAGFRTEAANRPDTFRIIDASASVDAIQTELRRHVAPLLRSRGLTIPTES
ncbi:dTMP kinase [Zavarzinella formosa]|uniref:dTMP kinase n=1 Tax=Zavarzinella formosa TaxID=360055 RepID=UPI0002FE0DBF|nr:dTMP kinase [Zavarzinella formosa]